MTVAAIKIIDNPHYKYMKKRKEEADVNSAKENVFRFNSNGKDGDVV